MMKTIKRASGCSSVFRYFEVRLRTVLVMAAHSTGDRRLDLSITHKPGEKKGHTYEIQVLQIRILVAAFRESL